MDAIDTAIFNVQTTANAALPATGGTTTGAILNAVGAVGTPSISFTGDTDTGIYHVTANAFSLVTNGATVIALTAGAAAVTGTFSVSGATTLAALTTTGLVSTAASAAGGAGFNLPHGADPTSPNNGDAWTTSAAGLKARINGVTVTFANSASTLLVANNLSDLNNAGTARTNLGLGSAATHASTDFLLVANNLSDVTASTARTNLGLGTLALLATPTFASAGAFNAGQDYATPLTSPTTTEVGYMGLPQNSQSTNYTMTAADRGKCIHFTANATFTIPPNGTLALPIGCAWEVSADPSVVVTIAYTTDTLLQVPNNATGSRTLTGPGSQFFEKKKSTTIWTRGDAT